MVSKGMWNLCRAAGITANKLRELANSNDQADINSYEDYYQKTMSRELEEYWTQERYTVHFDFVRDTLHVSISDSRYANRIPPSDRSDGFRWYFSFYCNLAAEVGEQQAKCILLDNPATELHLDGQRDIMRYLSMKVAREAQIIYVTHSPAMIDPFRLDLVRLVGRQDNEVGTTVSMPSSETYRSSDLLEPVRLAIGSSLVSTLFSNDMNVLVEGLQDKIIIDAAIESFADTRFRDRLVANGSIAQSPNEFIVDFFQRTGLPFAVLLDADSSGRDIHSRLKAKGLAANVITLDKIFPDKGNDFSIDDLFSASDYHAAVTGEYGDLNVPNPADNATKLARHYEKWFMEHGAGQKFSKRRVANALATKIRSRDIDDVTKGNLEILVRSLEAHFQPQDKGTPASAQDPVDSTVNKRHR